MSLSLSLSLIPPPNCFVFYNLRIELNPYPYPMNRMNVCSRLAFFSTSFECAGEKKTAEDSAMAMLFDSTEEQEPRKSMMLMKERKENTPIPSNLYCFRTLRVLTQN